MPPFTGNIISEPHPFREFLQLGIGAEIIYSFVIIFCSLMIYYGTKELYELSSYKGIKYFRHAFLFFAIAFFFRSFIKFIMTYFNVSAILDISPREFGFAFGQVTMLIFMYFSSLAILYLLYSVMYKKWSQNSKMMILFHLSAFIIASLSVLSRNMFVHLGLNLLLLIFVSIVVYVSYKDSKNKPKAHYNLYIIYMLLFIFWTLNIIDISIPRFLETFRLFIYLFSTGIFLLILYKVIKKTGPN
jgi:hypothetical protein